MIDEFNQHIVEKYPKIFSQNCEISIGDGWFDIIDRACYSIQSRIDHNIKQREWAMNWNEEVNNSDSEWDTDTKSFTVREERKVPELIEQVVATQIKEKFGGLRFYYSGGDDYMRGVVDMAENMSYVTCEDCGHPGKYRGNKRWFRTLCDRHAEEQGYIEDENSTGK